MNNKIDYELINIAISVLNKRYKKGVHHTAVALSANDNIYTSVHLDTKGFDVCAEPIALSKAMDDNVCFFKQIVCVGISNGKAIVINPCGNCRQILLEHTPNIKVIINEGGKYNLMSPSELLPQPYNGL